MRATQQMLDKKFNFCPRIECHALDYFTHVDKITLNAIEHGFRGIVTLPGRVEQFRYFVNKYARTSKPKIICVIDYPFGCQSIDVRAYQVQSAKMHGANEVEVVAPYSMFVQGDVESISTDIKTLCGIATECKMKLRYVLDTECMFISEKMRNFVCHKIAGSNINIISTSLGYYDDDISISDRVFWLRDIRSLSGCQIKTYINTKDPEEVSTLVKAGVNIIGLEWQHAIYVAHAYENIVENN